MLLPVVFSSPGVDVDVVYERPGGTPVLMDIYKPTQEGVRPAIIMIHGGAWMGGDRTQTAWMCERLVKRGFVVANVQYRLAPTHKWPAMLDDVQSAVRFMRRNAVMYSVDPSRIGAAGASAGGHLALLLGTRDTRDPSVSPLYSSKVAAVGNIFGVTDFTAMLPLWNVLADPVFGVAPADVRPIMADASPITHLDRGDAPVFTLHGTADFVVPIAQSRQLDAKLKELGIEHKFVQVTGEGHTVNLQNKEVADAIDALTEWLVLTLKP